MHLNIKQAEKAETEICGIQKQQGLGLVAAIFLLVIISSIVVALSNFTDTSVRAFGQDLNSLRASYAAQGATEVALHRLGFAGEACAGNMGEIDFTAIASGDGFNNCRVEMSCEVVTVSGVETWQVSAEATCGSGFEQAQQRMELRARRI